MKRRPGPAKIIAVLLETDSPYKQLIRPMMDYACSEWRSAARSYFPSLQVLRSKCVHLANCASWYVINRQVRCLPTTSESWPGALSQI